MSRPPQIPHIVADVSLQTVKVIRFVIKYFKKSNFSKALLRAERERLSLGPGLESIGKTRFTTLVWTAISLLRNLPGIRELCASGMIDIPVRLDLLYS